MPDHQSLSGVTGGGRDMTTKTLDRSQSAAAESSTVGIVSALVVGTLLLFAAGVSQAAILHDAAHDQRHAVAFPCH